MPTIEHVAIYAADALALKDYYVGVFGMKVVVENPGAPPGYFLTDEAGAAVEIIGRPAGKTGADQRWVCHLAFWVDDFQASKARLLERGVVFESDTAVDNETLQTAFFNDPEGNRLQIVWRKTRLGN